MLSNVAEWLRADGDLALLWVIGALVVTLCVHLLYEWGVKKYLDMYYRPKVRREAGLDK